MSNVLLNTSILTIYGLWKSSEIFIVDKSLAVRIGWQITRRLSDLVFVMSNGAIFNKDKNTTVRFSVRNCTYTNEKLYLRMSNVLLNNLQQYYSDLWPLFWKPSEIVNCIICWQIAQIIKMQYVWSLITLVSLAFSFSAVYQWIRLTSLFILIIFWAQKPQHILDWTF
jgi:hypothetical protein